MASLNKVILYGRLGRDPEVRTTKNGDPVTNLHVATNETWKDKNGEKQEKTEWHSVIVWGQTALNCGKFLKKGRSVLVEGSISSRAYEDNEGVKRIATEIRASNVTFADEKPKDLTYQQVAEKLNKRAENRQAMREQSHDYSLDEIPF